MATPEEIAAANEDGDFKAKMTRMFNEWALAKSNLLEPTLMLPGTLRFGANRMQLSNGGIQIASPESPATVIYFLENFTPGNPTLVPKTSIYAYTGVDGNWGTSRGFFESTALKTDLSKSFYSRLYASEVQVGDEILAFSMKIESGYSGLIGATAILTAQSTETKGTIQAQCHQFVVGQYTGSDPGVIALQGAAQDPTGITLDDGMIWYRSDLDVFRARINGATVNLATGTVGTTITNQTGTYSAVAGDFVRCSGTFTVTLPSAPANNSEVWVKNAGTGTITVARGGSDTMFVFTSGLTTVTLAPGEALGFKYYATGTEWSVF